MSDDDTIQAVSLREGARRRPGMFVSDCDGRGIEQLVLAVLSNAVSEHRRGRCSTIHLEVEDDLITVRDNGPGMPLDEEHTLSRLTGHHDGRATDEDARRVYLGSYGTDLAVVNALSATFEIEAVRAGRVWRVAYAQGLPAAPLTSAPSTAQSGTTVRFRPDPEIFRAGSRLHRRELTGRLELIAFLAPALRLTWSFGADSAARRGLAGLVAQHLDRPLGPIAHRRASVGNVDVEVAIGWHRPHHVSDGEPHITSIVNLAATDQHGTHVEGLRDAVATLWGGDPSTARVLLQHGLAAAVAVELAAPSYGGAEKRELRSPEVRAAVCAVAGDALRAWAAANPEALAAVRAQAVGSLGDDFRIISARDVIRRRPAMYLGADGPDGVLVLVLELVAHAIEHHRAGRCSAIDVAVDGDVVTVRDDGPGLPLDTASGAWWLRSTMPGIANPWPPDAPPELPRGYRLGLGAMIALGSEVAIATVNRGRAMRVTYRDGEAVEPLSSEPTGAPTGTTIRLRPDPALFSDVRPPRDKLAARLRRLARKLPDLHLTWWFEDDPR